MPTRLEVNAVVRPLRRVWMLPSIAFGEASKPYSPTTMPANVPRMPSEVRIVAVCALSRLQRPTRLAIIARTRTPPMAKIA